MKFFRKTEFSSSLGQKPFFGIKRMEEMLNRHRARRKAEKNLCELLKLGPHLLQDLGFDPKGQPLKPNGPEKIVYDRWQ
jgi:hypothetical protein